MLRADSFEALITAASPSPSNKGVLTGEAGWVALAAPFITIANRRQRSGSQQSRSCPQVGRGGPAVDGAEHPLRDVDARTRTRAADEANTS